MKSISMLLVIGAVLSLQQPVFATHLSTDTVKEITTVDTLTYIGTVEAVNSGTASSQTSGQVTATLVDVGDIVGMGDVILKLKDTQQKANFDRAIANVQSTQANFDAALKEFVRVSDIFKKGLVSQSVADKALSQRDSTKAALNAAKASLTSADELLEYTRVKAPYSGIILERHVEVGETVNVGTPLYTGMSLEFLRVVAEVPQKDIDKVRQHKSASVELPNGSAIRVMDQSLTFFGYADPKTSTFKIRANLPKNTEGLYPGMYLKTSFVVGNNVALVIPSESIVNRGEVTAVYVQKDHRLDFRQIRVGRNIDSTTVEVLSGLSVGDIVVTSPSAAISIIQSQVATQAKDGEEDE